MGFIKRAEIIKKIRDISSNVEKEGKNSKIIGILIWVIFEGKKLL
jgi:hypothetical protein